MPVIPVPSGAPPTPTPRTWSDNIADVRVTFNFLDYFPRSLRRQLPLFTFRFGMFMIKLMRGMYQVTIDFKG